MPVSHHHLVYLGHGSSDVHVMLYVNRLDGLTISISENKHLTQIAKHTVLSDDALSILRLECSPDSPPLERYGFILQDWEKVQTAPSILFNAAASE